jgi:DNA-binding NarL/FixJ family response regulator
MHMRSSWHAGSTTAPSGDLAVALACAEGDWPLDNWPAPDDPFHTRFVPPPYDSLRADRHETPDITVLRCDDPADAFPQLRAAMGEKSTSVIVISPRRDAEQIAELWRNGVTGYLVDGDYSASMLSAAVLDHASGRTHLSPLACETVTPLRERARLVNLDNGLATKELRERLSPRERQVMELLTHGLGAPEIGQRLHLSEKTVRNNLSNIYAKLEVRGSTEAVLQWLGALPSPLPTR